MNTRKQTATETRIVTLDPGMYIVRFNAIPTLGEGAILSVAPGDGDAQMDFFPSEGVKNNTIFNQSDVIVVRCAGGEGNLLITSLCSAGGKPVGTRIDRIAGAAQRPGAEVSRQRQSPQLTQSRSTPLDLSGHVEMVGDTRAAPGDWLGDPRGNRRLEGFSLDWKDRPEDIDIAYSCVVGGLGRSPAVLSGGFCGSRQRAAPITALTVSLVGRQANDYELDIEAVFAGCPAQKLSSGVEARGLTGREALVALRAGVKPRRGS